MKNFFRAIAATIMSCSAISGNAQVISSATASVTIQTPTSISKTDDISFQNIIANYQSEGTIVLSPAGDLSASVKPFGSAASPTATPASFIVFDNSTYTISLPTRVKLEQAAGKEKMTASRFQASITSFKEGIQKIAVGVSLNVAKAQSPGVYSSEEFQVVINYY